MGTETATKAAETFVDQGILGAAVVLLGLAVVYLFVELQRTGKRGNERCEAMLERVVEIAALYKSAMAETASAVKEMEHAITAATTAVQTLAREAEGEAREARHGIANLTHGQQGIATILDRLDRGRS